MTKHFPVHQPVLSRRAGRLRSGPARRANGTAPVVHAVEDVTLALPAAHVTAVVGESGSGKSTLARMLARLIKPTAGQILLGGQPVPGGGRRRREYARQVQLVLQDPFASLNPVHDVRYHL
ncbi:MAG: ATP-binding cassette domain-containing protein, partial [Actinobacteria bacterium]|nr:ATP-binding cassette domain-containing protein [Actinomycetota bacterium]